MAADRNDDAMEATVSSRAPRRARQTINPANSIAMLTEQSSAEAPDVKATTKPREPESSRLRPPTHSALEGRLEVRPIGTALGLRELAALHKRTWSTLNVQEKRVHALLWPLAIHFGLYAVGLGNEQRRPPLLGAF